jgi:hypothetical protein
VRAHGGAALRRPEGGGRVVAAGRGGVRGRSGGGVDRVGVACFVPRRRRRGLRRGVTVGLGIAGPRAGGRGGNGSLRVAVGFGVGPRGDGGGGVSVVGFGIAGGAGDGGYGKRGVAVGAERAGAGGGRESDGHAG